MAFLGIDSSNYTTSVAISDNTVTANLRRVLDVKQGERGLRQSDALFQHTVNFPLLFAELGKRNIDAVGVSCAPRSVEGSYMPCFLAGVSVASAVAESAGVPLYRFSHQQGHMAAALYSAGREDLHGGKYYFFHLSGGTTELLLADGDRAEIVGRTLDISVGQLIDRTGVMLGMKFPCGVSVEKACGGEIPDGIPKIRLKGGDCNLSGIENKVAELIRSGMDEKYVCGYVIGCVRNVICLMLEYALEKNTLPVVCAGGVASNASLRKTVSEKFGAFFAKPEYSSDNAAGIARLTEMRFRYGG